LVNEDSKYLWCLYNTESEELLEGLVRDEVRILMSRLPIPDRMHWLVWREDWAHWKVVTTLPELLKISLRAMKQPPPEIPEEFREDQSIIEIKRLYQGNDVEDEISTNAEVVAISEIPDLPVESEGAEFVQRAHQRIKRKYKILIECNRKKFETTSVDVSVGGLLLIDPLPDWVFGYCTITIIKPNNGESVQLTCSIVENQLPQKRHRVALSPLKKRTDQSRLHAWLSAV
jgi:hypothetical protein